ncbi:restriction endonuclease subunit S [Curtobacterium flaccumfaciens]|nr:restriction endonuclease subunit S [Curtobacterium flaccumfaciens]
MDDQEWLLSSSMMKLTVDPTVLDSRFVLLYFRDKGRDELLSRASTVGTPGIGQPLTSLRSISIPLPPLAEQQAIAQVMGALEDKIAANTALAATAEHMLQAEIDAEWLRGEDRSSTLSDFAELNPKVAAPRTQAAVYIDMKRLPESGWSIDGLDYREPMGGARFQNGDTLLARITPCLENRKTGFVDHLEDEQVGIGSTEFIVLRARNDIAAPISFLLATAPRFRDHAIQHMVGTSGRQRVAVSDLASFKMPTPEPGWLAGFGSRAVAVFQAVAAQSAENRTLAATREALLPQLMSGKLRVRDAEAAASEAGA